MNLYKKVIVVLAIVCCFVNMQVNAATTAPVKKTSQTVQKKVTVPNQPVYTSVSPLDLVNNPAKYLNKNITFDAEFVAFTSLGLDYKPAFRDGTKYIGVLIKRPDVTNHTIPLSEMKIFITREMAEKNIDIEAGDKIKVQGKVYSAALGDPWIDVKTFTMLTHKAKAENKK